MKSNESPQYIDQYVHNLHVDLFIVIPVTDNYYDNELLREM